MEPISLTTVAWIIFGAYLVITAGLAIVGWLKTDSLESFAVGKRDMGPWLVGITMGASLSSTATFVINPGFVYTHGLSAFLHLGASVGLGLAVALYVLSPRFRRIGVDGHALTLPHWIGARYQSTALRVLFGLISLMSIAFLVLIAGSVQILLQQTLELSANAALLLTIGFVFSYIMIGGTYAHAYTNTLQGVMMIGVTVIILWQTAQTLTTDGFFAMLEARDANLLAAVNPASTLYGDFFSVYVAGFVIGFAIVCQPHLLMKALYLKRDQDVTKYVTVTVSITALFFTLLLAGLAAHADIDPTSLARQDAVMVLWLKERFGAIPFVFISVALVAAGMSTLDGILVAMSTVMSNDVFLPIAERTFLARRTPEVRARYAYRFGQLSLVGMGIVTWLILSGEPPKLLGIFGQTGVYGIVAAAVSPILIGVLMPERTGLRSLALLLSVVGFLTYAILNSINYVQRTSPESALARGWPEFAESNPVIAGLITHGNPAVPATLSILLCGLIAVVWLAARREPPKASAG